MNPDTSELLARLEEIQRRIHLDDSHLGVDGRIAMKDLGALISELAEAELGHVVAQERLWPQELDPARGWVPACPEPFYVGWWRLRKARCECDKVFKSRNAYRAHWREVHGD